MILYSQLMSRTERDIKCAAAGWTYRIIKVSYDNDTDFLFLFSSYSSDDALSFRNKPSYAGFISYKTSKLYDCDDIIVRLIGAPMACRTSLSDLRDQMVEAVAVRVQKEVNNNPVPITVQPIPTGWDLKDQKWRDEHIEYGATNEAKRWFYYGESKTRFVPSINYDNLPTQKVIRFINDKDAFVLEETQSYIYREALWINSRLWANEETRVRYEEMERTPGDHHVRRNIAKSLQNGEVKVTIHLVKERQSFVGKIEASTLRHMEECSYSTYDLDAKDRERFFAMFGRSASIFPKDIERITHGKSTLYIADQ